MRAAISWSVEREHAGVRGGRRRPRSGTGTRGPAARERKKQLDRGVEVVRRRPELSSVAKSSSTRYGATSASVIGRRNARGSSVSTTWRKHAASPAPLGVQGTIRARSARIGQHARRDVERQRLERIDQRAATRSAWRSRCRTACTGPRRAARVAGRVSSPSKSRTLLSSSARDSRRATLGEATNVGVRITAVARAAAGRPSHPG